MQLTAGWGRGGGDGEGGLGCCKASYRMCTEKRSHNFVTEYFSATVILDG